MKMLVVLTHWSGDLAQAEDTAVLLADLLPEKSETTSLVFFRRFDSKTASDEVTQHCAKKFERVIHQRCRRRGVGFPMGCNEMAYDVFAWSREFYLAEQKLEREFDCLLILEADCVMTCRDWDKKLIAEWRKTAEEKKLVCGAVIPWGYGKFDSHVNATALYHPLILSSLPILMGGPGQSGWDFFHGRSIVPVARATKLIKLDYKKPTITEEELYLGRTPVLLHGVKDDSARRIVRKKMIP